MAHLGVTQNGDLNDCIMPRVVKALVCSSETHLKPLEILYCMLRNLETRFYFKWKYVETPLNPSSVQMKYLVC